MGKSELKVELVISKSFCFDLLLHLVLVYLFSYRYVDYPMAIFQIVVVLNKFLTKASVNPL